jgi:hypothetical protein
VFCFCFRGSANQQDAKKNAALNRQAEDDFWRRGTVVTRTQKSSKKCVHKSVGYKDTAGSTLVKN